MRQEIGSNFWFDINEIKGNSDITPFLYGYKGNDYRWLSSGRSASTYVLKTIEERNPNIVKKALLPPYTCHTVFNPFYDEGYEISCYEIDRNFKVSFDSFISIVDKEKPSVVLLQRYFGFETFEKIEKMCEELRKRNIIIIEDCTQALFSDLQTIDADYYVSSVRKYFGTPDGGFAICKDGKFNISLDEQDNERIDSIIEASKIKKDYIEKHIGLKEEFLSLYRKGEDLLDDDKSLRKINDTSLKIQSSLSRKEIAEARRNNYRKLYEEIKNIEDIDIIFNNVEECETPLYMPIYVKGDRLGLQKHLAKSSIYVPIVWPKPERTPELCEVAEDFYNHIICLVIDQRYDEFDMSRMAYRIKEYFKDETIDKDIYYMKNWRDLYYVKDGDSSERFTYKSDKGTIVYPYVKRKALDSEYFDIITPYGFNGPMIVNQKCDDVTSLIEDYEKAFDKYCNENKIIAEYVRFCPWEENHKLFGQYYSLRDNNSTIAIDLTVDDILMDEISSKRRNQIRLAYKKGVTIEFDFEGKTVEDFYNLYQNTIAKNDIGNYYLFDIDFLKKHFDMLKGNCFIANAKVDGKTISSSYVLVCGDNMHYHLSANDYTMNEYNGNSVLLYEMAKLGKAWGCKYLHLGGVGVAEKSLMNFKLSFTKNGIYPFYVGTKIRNQKAYDELCEIHKSENANYFPAYRG